MNFQVVTNKEGEYLVVILTSEDGPIWFESRMRHGNMEGAVAEINEYSNAILTVINAEGEAYEVELVQTVVG